MRVPAETRIVVESDADVIMARQEVRRIGREMGFHDGDVTRIVTAVTEVSSNIIIFAGKGEIIILSVSTENRGGIEIKAIDHGPGIQDVALAMSDGYSTQSRSGLGLSGARRLMDELWIDTSPSKGTTITMRKWITTLR